MRQEQKFGGVGGHVNDSNTIVSLREFCVPMVCVGTPQLLAPLRSCMRLRSGRLSAICASRSGLDREGGRFVLGSAAASTATSAYVLRALGEAEASPFTNHHSRLTNHNAFLIDTPAI